VLHVKDPEPSPVIRSYNISASTLIRSSNSSSFAKTSFGSRPTSNWSKSLSIHQELRGPIRKVVREVGWPWIPTVRRRHGELSLSLEPFGRCRSSANS
jgi:hypothetical protein